MIVNITGLQNIFLRKTVMEHWREKKNNETPGEVLQEDGIVNSVVSLISIIVQKYVQQQNLDPSVHSVHTQCNFAAVAVLWSLFTALIL